MVKGIKENTNIISSKITIYLISWLLKFISNGHVF